jgi:FixJ family two-component response regulator/predicted  nucleic acid-binding Zn-ribbon protein
MEKQSLFVVDTDKKFQDDLASLCPPDKIDLRFYSSAVEILSLLGKEKPAAIFLSLDTPDLDDFVMYDLLKKTNVNFSIPVFATYSQQSEKDFNKYQNLKFKAEGYYKKPVSKEKLAGILKKYLEIETKTAAPAREKEKERTGAESAGPGEALNEVEVDDDEFSDDNIDRLVRGELVDLDFDADLEAGERIAAVVDEEADDKDSTNEMKNGEFSGVMGETKKELLAGIDAALEDDEFPVDLDIDIDVGGRTKTRDQEEVQKEEEGEKKREKEGRLNKDLEARVVSLESQNEFLRSENKKFSAVIKSLKADIEKKNLEIQELKTLTQNGSEQEKQNRKLEEEKASLQQEIKQLCNRLTDKDRELEAKNHEFEVVLKNKRNEMLKETEERMAAEFKLKEEQLNSEIERLNEETDRLNQEKGELKKHEDSLSRTISTLAEEKVTLAEKVDSLEINLANLQDEIKEKETRYRAAFKGLNDQLEQVRNEEDSYKKRMEELIELMKKTLSSTQTGE